MRPQAARSGAPAATVERVSRVPRTSLPDGFFHVSARGVDRTTPLFRDPEDRTTFLRLLRRTVDRFDWTCHALCVMSTHYHLVLESTQPQLSRGLQWLNSVYAMNFNRRHRRFGHVFADRFETRAIDSEEYLHAACAYVVLNPVKAGLCESAEDWPWSYSRYGLEAAA
jgi:REP element-mobilizing transposase RayT